MKGTDLFNISFAIKLEQPRLPYFSMYCRQSFFENLQQSVLSSGASKLYGSETSLPNDNSGPKNVCAYILMCKKKYVPVCGSQCKELYALL